MTKRGRKPLPIEERICAYCGSTDYYAKGLCFNCYMRNKRNGSPDYKPPRKSTSIADILRLRGEGMRQKDIAEELGLTKQWVSFVFKTHKTNGDIIREMTNQELVDLFLTGDICVGKIAEDVVCTHMCADCWLNYLNKEAIQNEDCAM